MNKPIPKKELLQTLEEIIEDHEYRISKARSPRSKRASKNAAHFFQSILYYLNQNEQ